MEPQDGSSISSISQFQRLPPEALARVLGAVPQLQRLASCSLVCRAWRDAALAATTDLELNFNSHKLVTWSAQMSAWLARHGSGLHSLSAPPGGWDVLELPWASIRNLRRLRLDFIQISCNSNSSSSRPAGTASQPGSSSIQQLAQLTSLTSLVLQNCRISSGVLDLYQQQLPALRQLRELVLQSFDPAWGDDGLSAELAALLRQLTALTRLKVGIAPDGAAAVISSLSSLQLQDLGLQAHMTKGHASPISWSDVPASVTALKLSGLDIWQLQAASGTGCPLTALQRLSVEFGHSFGSTGVAALSGLPQLRQLNIGAWLGDGDASDVRPLLAFVAQQQQLQSLALDCSMTLPEAQTQHYAALAASSQLTALSITVAEQSTASAMFAAMSAGQRLPLLQQLRLWTCRSVDSEDEAMPWGLAAQDVSRLLQGCPGLRELVFSPQPLSAAAAGVTWSNAAGAATAQLTNLVVGSEDVDAAFISQFLARLTGLQDLEAKKLSGDITWAALVPLTRLTGLTRLAIKGFPVPDPEDYWEAAALALANMAGPEQPPDVAQQLRAKCWRGGNEARVACLLDEEQQLVAKQQARIADLEARLAAAEAAPATAEARLAAAAAAAGFVDDIMGQ